MKQLNNKKQCGQRNANPAKIKTTQENEKVPAPPQNYLYDKQEVRFEKKRKSENEAYYQKIRSGTGVTKA